MQEVALKILVVEDNDELRQATLAFLQSEGHFVRGVAMAEDALAAYKKAYQTDPTSAFGGIIAFNCPVDLSTVQALAQQFVDPVGEIQQLAVGQRFDQVDQLVLQGFEGRFGQADGRGGRWLHGFLRSGV
jgi:CheY-like chemotaxis protein